MWELVQPFAAFEKEKDWEEQLGEDFYFAQHISRHLLREDNL